jgi:hypothetical protein
MLREMPKPWKVLTLVLTLLSASVIETRAQPASIDDATAIQATTPPNARVGLSTTLQRPSRRGPCNPKRRALTGAAIGFVVAMVAIRKAAKENDGTVGAKGTLAAGAYGAVLGLGIGLATCR